MKQPSKGIFSYLPALVYQFSGNSDPDLQPLPYCQSSPYCRSPQGYFSTTTKQAIFFCQINLSKTQARWHQSPTQKRFTAGDLLRNTIEGFYNLDSSHLLHVVFLTCYIEGDKYVAHLSSWTPPGTCIHSKISCWFPTVCMDSVQLQESHRHMVPDLIELMTKWRRQAINKKLNELW